MDVITLAESLLGWIQASGTGLGDDLEQLERVIREAVLEVGAQALEVHLSRQKLGYEGSRRVCGCGQDQRFVGYRAKTIATLMGPITLRRAYYHCGSCGTGALPYDQRMGLGRTACSVGLAKAATWCAANHSFASAQAMLEELTGQRLGTSTIHRLSRQVGQVAAEHEAEVSADTQTASPTAPGRLYTAVDGVMVHQDGRWQEMKVATCYWEDARGDRVTRHCVRGEAVEGFVGYVQALTRRCGVQRAGEKVLLGDGARWIWRQIGPLLGDDATHITDWYHVAQHVGQCAEVLHGQGHEARAWSEPIKTMLWEGRLRDLRAHLDQASQAATEPADRSAVDALITYIRHQGDRLVYDDFRARGLDIGSGCVEAACKHVVQTRLKGSGMRWSSPGAQATASLRANHLNHQRDSLWKLKPLAA